MEIGRTGILPKRLLRTLVDDAEILVRIRTYLLISGRRRQTRLKVCGVDKTFLVQVTCTDGEQVISAKHRQGSQYDHRLYLFPDKETQEGGGYYYQDDGAKQVRARDGLTILFQRSYEAIGSGRSLLLCIRTRLAGLRKLLHPDLRKPLFQFPVILALVAGRKIEPDEQDKQPAGGIRCRFEFCPEDRLVFVAIQ